jgi:hypothetical protein
MREVQIKVKMSVCKHYGINVHWGMPVYASAINVDELSAAHDLNKCSWRSSQKLPSSGDVPPCSVIDRTDGFLEKYAQSIFRII